MLGEEYSHALVVEVQGRPLREQVAARLVSGLVDDSLQVPDLFVLRFSDEGSTVLDQAGVRIGAQVRLLVQSSGPTGPVPLISGEVTALECEVGPDGAQTVVRGLDHSHRLFRGRRVEAYLQCTASDIARRVAVRAGLRVGVVDHPGPVLPHVAQDGVNDWEFLRRLADEVGAEVAVVDGALDFRGPTSAEEAPPVSSRARRDALVLERGVNVLSLRATVTASEQVSEVEVRGWDVARKKPLVAVVPARTRSAVLDGVEPAGLAAQFGSPRFVAPVSSYNQQQQCEAAAEALSEHLAGGFAEVEGVARGNPRLRAGTAVTLAGVGAPFSGRYTLSATRHEFSQESGYVTAFTVSNRSERSLYGVAAGAVQRPGLLSGVVVATVTDLRDPEVRGRVRVTFPVMSDSYESHWARPVQLGAGEGRGAVVLPEVGDEVLVAFGQGDFGQPFVLGGLYNGVDVPSRSWRDHVGSTDGKVQRRAFVSRTGMAVEMLESPDGERLELSTSDGNQRVTLVQKPNASVEIVSEGPVSLTAKRDVSVTASGGDVTLEGRRVSLTASSDLELSGLNVTVSARAKGEVSAASVKVSGSASAEVSGGGTTTIRGGVVRIN